MSVLIWLGDTDGGSVQSQIDLLGFTWVDTQSSKINNYEFSSIFLSSILSTFFSFLPNNLLNILQNM